MLISTFYSNTLSSNTPDYISLNKSSMSTSNRTKQIENRMKFTSDLTITLKFGALYNRYMRIVWAELRYLVDFRIRVCIAESSAWLTQWNKLTPALHSIILSAHRSEHSIKIVGFYGRHWSIWTQIRFSICNVCKFLYRSILLLLWYIKVSY